MATYDYQCKTCGNQFEYVQSMKDDPITHCLCGKNGVVERMITGTAGIIFKGTGFYVTDYKKDSQKPASTESAKTETPVATTPSTPTPVAPTSSGESSKA